MKKFIRILAIVVTVLCVLLSLAYIVSLMLSSFVSLPFEVEPNVFMADWFFMSIPILALLMCILLQVASLKRSRKKKK